MSLATYQSAETKALAAVFGEGWRDLVARLVFGYLESRSPEQALLTVKRWGLSYTFRVKHLIWGLTVLGFKPSDPEPSV